MDDYRNVTVFVKERIDPRFVILLLDFAALTFGIAMLLHNGTGIHMVFSILIGLAITIGFVFLARIPYIGRLFQIGLGLVWGLIAYSALDNIFHYSKDVGLMTGLRENDQIWWWAIVIVVNLIFIALHIAAFNKYLATLNFRKKDKLNTDSGMNVEISDRESYDHQNEPVEVMFSDKISDMEDRPYNGAPLKRVDMSKPFSLEEDDIILMDTGVFTDDNDLNK